MSHDPWEIILIFVIIKANLCDHSLFSLLLLLPFYEAIAMGSHKMCILNAVQVTWKMCAKCININDFAMHYKTTP